MPDRVGHDGGEGNKKKAATLLQPFFILGRAEEITSVLTCIADRICRRDRRCRES